MALEPSIMPCGSWGWGGGGGGLVPMGTGLEGDPLSWGMPHLWLLGAANPVSG